MATGSSMPVQSGTGFYKRQDSIIDEEDLFGDGRQNKEVCRSEQENSNANEDNSDSGNDSFEIRDEEFTEAALPHFSMLAPSSGSSKGSDQDIRSEEGSEGASGAAEHITTRDEEFKEIYRRGRSVSADDKRNKFRTSRDVDVFDAIIYVTPPSSPKLGPKSNSLPDLVPTQSINALPASPNSCPDVTENTEISYNSLELQRMEQRQAIEGKSTYRNPPKPRRSVSINEDANKYKTFDSEDHPEQSDEPNIDSGAECKTVVPTTPTESRRFQFQSKSSGYNTGDSDPGTSQERSVDSVPMLTTQTSQGGVSEVSSIFDRDESMEDISDEYKTKGNLVNTELFDGLKSIGMQSNNDSFRSESYLSSGVSDSYRSGENSYMSQESIRKSDNFGNFYSETTKTNSNSSGSSLSTLVDTTSTGYEQDGLDRKSNDEMPHGNIMLPLRNNDVPACTKSHGTGNNHSPDLSLPKSADRASYSNMPTFVAEITESSSFSIPTSQLVKVEEEERKQWEKVRKQLSKESLPTPDDPQSIGPPLSQGSQQYTLMKRHHMTKANLQEFERLLLAHSPTEIMELFQPSISPCVNQGGNSRGASRREVIDKKFTVEDFLMSSRCQMFNCLEKCCIKMATIRKILTTDLPDTHPRYDLVKQYCRLLWEHCEECEGELQCSVMYCGDILKCWKIVDTEDDDHLSKQMVPHIQQQAIKPVMSCFLDDNSRFYKLDNSYNSMEPEEFVSHLPLFQLGQFGKAVLCMDQQFQTMCVISTYPGLDYKHHLSLYNSRMRDLVHPHIVKHLWLLEYSDAIQVCTPFMTGGSLEDHLLSRKWLPWSQAVHYLLQILEAVAYLHKHGVVYLNWQSKNMLFPSCHRRNIKVSNFGLSCPMQCEMDNGAIKQCLPAHICPPELLEYKIDFLCDSWGSGCLLYELVTGSPVLQQLRHQSREAVYKAIKDGSLQPPDTLPDIQKNVFTLCWKTNPRERKSLDRIITYLSSISAVPS